MSLKKMSLLDDRLATIRQSWTDARAHDSLTTRERQIVLVLSDGLSNKEIARKLGLSEGTVKVHLHNIFGKLGIANRTALALRAYAKTPDAV
jgi:two-component system, NarL family, nitrate/nitrite response regulator NarL